MQKHLLIILKELYIIRAELTKMYMETGMSDTYKKINELDNQILVIRSQLTHYNVKITSDNMVVNKDIISPEDIIDMLKLSDKDMTLEIKKK